MPCSGCAAQFTVLRRRRSCGECARPFCPACCPRRPAPPAPPALCPPCRVLSAPPLARHQLEPLRVRDLQSFLLRRHVSTAGCVEKEDLINLALAHVNSADFVQRPSQQSQSEISQAIANIKGFANNVLSALDIGGNERSAKFNSRADQNVSSDAPSSNFDRPRQPTNGPTTSRSVPTAPETPSPGRTPSVPSGGEAVRLPGDVPRGAATDASVESPIPVLVEDLTDTNDCLEVEDDPDDPDWEIISPPAEPLPQDSDVLLLDGESTPLRASGRAASDLDLPSRTGDGSSGDTSSLKRVPMIVSHNSTSRINLNDLKDLSQVEALKVKQLKELLILNRVDFKGCCERNELLERAKRLWQENTKSREDLDTSESQELCRICMDAPMECVMLECGHIATCINCGKRLTECPICRGYVIRVVRFFRS